MVWIGEAWRGRPSVPYRLKRTAKHVFMAHRIREAMREGASDAFTGIVEIDETIYGRAATHPVGRRTKQTRKSQPITNAAHKNVVLSLVQRGGKVRGWSCKVAEIAAKLRCSKCNSREVNVYEPRR